VKYGGEKVKESWRTSRRDNRGDAETQRGEESFYRRKRRERRDFFGAITSLRKALRKAGREDGMSKGRE